jgi:SAM-dependent methyltransferase
MRSLAQAKISALTGNRKDENLYQAHDTRFGAGTARGAMRTSSARYDGYADWYDGWNKPAEHAAPEVRELLGQGEGPCLDLGCGSGHYFDVIGATGRTAVGLDYSADQLRAARYNSKRA